MIESITPVVLVYNEADNLARCLERVAWAREALVVDSYSTDESVRIARGFPNTRVIQREFDRFGAQWNWAIRHARTEWVLTLDADYVLLDDFEEELGGLRGEHYDGFSAAFDFAVNGQRVRCHSYPRRTLLFRTAVGRYEEDGHRQRLINVERVGELRSRVLHDDRKPLERWLPAQLVYARQEEQKIRHRSGSWGIADRLRAAKLIMPLAIVVYTLVMRGGVRDGRAGLFYTLQRLVAESLLSLVMLETDLRSDAHGKGAS